MAVASCILGHTVSMIKKGEIMTQNELYDKFLKLSVKLDNMYRDSELDITDAEYDKIKNWILNIAYVLGLACQNFNEKKLKSFENAYDEAEKIIYSKRGK